MAHFAHKLQTVLKKTNTKRIIMFVIAISLFFSAIYIVKALLPAPSDGQSQTSEKDYTVLTLALYQSYNYVQEDTVYEFKYVLGGQTYLLQVTSEGQTSNYAAVSGATYNPFDLKVTIYSATERMLVVHVTP